MFWDYQMKTCSKCKVDKSKSEFSPRKIAKDGLRSSCKSCNAAFTKQYVKDNQDKVKAYKKSITEKLKEIPAFKICGKCKAKKPSSEFNKNNAQPDGLQNNCTECRKDRYKDVDGDRIREKERLRRITYINNPKEAPATRVCRTCKIVKSITEFDKQSGTKYGYCYRCKSCHKEYRTANPIKFREWNKNYKKSNRERLTKYENELSKARRKIDPLFALKCRVRGLISTAISNGGYKKSSKTCDILGCSFEEFKCHLENQFESGMSWELRSEWHIDHYFPVSKARDEAHLLELNHYSNLRPMWAEDNLKKGSTIPDEFLSDPLNFYIVSP